MNKKCYWLLGLKLLIVISLLILFILVIYGGASKLKLVNIVFMLIYGIIIIELLCYSINYTFFKDLSLLQDDKAQQDIQLVNFQKVFMRNFHQLMNHMTELLESIKDIKQAHKEISNKHIAVNEKLKRKIDINDIILQITNQLTQIEGQNELFQYIIDKAVEMIQGAEMGSVLVVKGNFNTLEYVAAQGYSLEQLRKVNIKLEDTFLYKPNKRIEDQSRIISNIKAFNKSYLNKKDYYYLKRAKGFDAQTTLCTPIFIDGHLYCILNIDSTKKNAFKEQDIIVMKYFAQQLKNAIKNYQLIEKITYLSRYDRLTELYNRHYFEALTEDFCKPASASKRNFTLAILDLNEFKIINDTFGHIVGDHVIKLFGEKLKREFKNEHILARYGGDEFIGVFNDVSKAKLCQQLDHLALQLSKNPIVVGDRKITISFSYGIAAFSNDGCDMDTLIRKADQEMYEDKRTLKKKQYIS